jgi:hypothetical protein
MKAVASWLRQRAAEMSGMPQTLASTAGRTEFGPVEWAQASHLRIASTQVSGAVAQYWDQVVGNMNAAADAIDASADGLARVEATNLDMIKAQEVVLTSNASGVQAGGR